MLRNFLYVFLLISFFSFSNNIEIKGNFIGEVNFEKVFLKQYFFTIKNIQSAKVEKNKFSLDLDNNIQPGIYRLFFGDTDATKFIDIIINGKDDLIEFTFDINNYETPVSFLNSDENKKYIEFLNLHNSFLAKFSVNLFFLQNYPDVKESVYLKVLDSYKKEIQTYEKKRKQFLESSNKVFPWAIGLVKTKPLYFPNEFKKDAKIADYERIKNYWNDIDTSDESLLNSPIYFDLIFDYFKFYLSSNTNSFQNEVEHIFIENTDKVIAKFSSNPNTQKFAIEYLQKGFKEIGMESLLKYVDLKYKSIILNYLKEEKEIEAYTKRLENYEKLKVGNLAPNIEWKSSNNLNSISSLHQIKSEKILVVFWSSDCDHCSLVMPKIDEWASTNKNITVLAVGIENSKDQHIQELKKYKNLLHYSDYNGWKSKCVNDYDVMATPTFFLLDQNKMILKKASSFEEIKQLTNK